MKSILLFAIITLFLTGCGEESNINTEWKNQTASIQIPHTSIPIPTNSWQSTLKVGSWFLKKIEKYRNWTKVFSSEITIMMKNIKWYLKNRTNKILTEDEVYYPIINQLLFPFIEEADCNSLVNDYWIENKKYFLKECNYTLEYKNALTTKNTQNISKYLFDHNHIFSSIQNRKCKDTAFNCFLLFDDTLKKDVL